MFVPDRRKNPKEFARIKKFVVENPQLSGRRRRKTLNYMQISPPSIGREKKKTCHHLHNYPVVSLFLFGTIFFFCSLRRIRRNVILKSSTKESETQTNKSPFALCNSIRDGIFKRLRNGIQFVAGSFVYRSNQEQNQSHQPRWRRN